MDGFKTGLTIGVLATAVVALIVAVIILAVGGDEGDDGDGGNGSETTSEEQCLIDYGPQEANAQAELDFRTSGLECDQADEIYSALDDRGAIDFAESFNAKPVRERGWICVYHPTALHPVLAHCSAPNKRFLVLSLEPVAHSFDKPPPPPPPPGTQASCGNLVEGGAGTYNVAANGVDCNAARQMAAIWEGVCFGPDEAPNPCPVNDGFGCTRTQVGYELASIQCIKDDRAVTFENGA